VWPAAADVACVLLFVVIGRANHGHGETVSGVASTAWPFLAGLAVGWVVALEWPVALGRRRPAAALGWRRPAAALGWRRPAALVPSGVAAWLGTVVVGMVLRVVAGQGTAVSFSIVALCFLGLFLLGWRLLARFVPAFRPSGPRRHHEQAAAAAVHRGDRPAEGPGG
jgi:hypothetical protein